MIRAAGPRRTTPGTDNEPQGGSLADVTERMFALFEDQLSLHAIARAVRHARRELDIRHSGPVRVEAVERLAYQRLSRLVSSAADSADPVAVTVVISE